MSELTREMYHVQEIAESAYYLMQHAFGSD